jgi:hypothetical protein
MNAKSGDGASDADIGELIRDDIVHTLRTRRARPDTAVRKLEDGVKAAGLRAWRMMQRHPYLGVLAVATLGIAAASAIGVGELAVGIGAAYATLNVLKGRETPEEAVEQVIREAEHV